MTATDSKAQERRDQKTQLRRDLKSRLQAIGPEQQALLQGRVREWLKSQSGVWGAFWPLPGEPDLRSLWKEPLGADRDSSITWVFPRIQEQRLTFHRAGDEDWTTGPYGTREPGPHAPVVEMSGIQGLLIPGLGFDRRGRRLGRGKGFYDRALADFGGKKVGVCFEIQWVTEVPREAHDQNMDVVVTEAGPLVL